ncbi:hypothetical protein MCUN1_000599 [Malassezia cuniculi]|uniref:ferric-chelate reductase (NADPH) n=1 Tax=Malassezia cuniculi TaxID=948313 RepID=A0AAF0ESC4_9BASI|nr:hypothetical protein MCUN1_000599 [Malassezia cuniculi]
MTPDELQNVLLYMRAHELSHPSYRYVFILWFIIVGFGVVLGLERAFGILERTIVGAVWTKWAARHRVLKIGSKEKEMRAKAAVSQSGARALQSARRHVFNFMDLGRMTVLVLFSLVLLCLTFIGADYINPSHPIFLSSSFPTTHDRNAAMLTNSRRGIQWGLGVYGPVTFQIPQFTIPYHTWWTMGDRTGDICNALTPFVILIALKQTPFALASLPIFGGFSIDLLHYLHRWGGRAIWVYATAHTITWSIQLAKDGMNGYNLWHYMVDVPRFRWAWTAYSFLTLLVIFSLNPIRRRHYEVFYVLHVVFAIGFMVATWAHHPQLGWWMLASFILWGGERAYRLVQVVWVNYSRAPKGDRAALTAPSSVSLRQPDLGRSLGDASASSILKEPNTSHEWPDKSSVSVASSLPPSAPLGIHETIAAAGTPPLVPDAIRPIISWDLTQHLYPGFAFVQPLAGETLRLVLRTTYPLRWKAGQWVYLRLPQLSWIQSHPFTIASVNCMKETTFQNQDQLVLLLIRARSGLTRRLWEFVCEACEHANSRTAENFRSNNPDGVRLAMFPALNGEHVQAHVNGIYLRSIVDGPFGSSARIDWGAYSTALVICGGSGVSFGISVLEYLCRQVARIRNGEEIKSRFGRKFHLRRVRFVWVLREFAHIQWVASTLRYCLELLPPESLRVQMFVTCINERQVRPVEELTRLQPPGDPGLHSPQIHGGDLEETRMTIPSAAALFTRGSEWNDLDLTVNDITQFDEERDTVSSLDRSMNERIMRQGKMRRAKTRRRQTQKRDGHAARMRIQKRRESQVSNPEANVGWQSHADQQAVIELSAQPTNALSPPPHHGKEAERDSRVVETPAAVYEAPLSDYFSLPRNDYAPVASHNPEMIPLDTIPNEGRPFTASSAGSRPGTSGSIMRPMTAGSQMSADYDMQPKSNVAIPSVNLEPMEARDLEIVSELARAGYPKLDEIVAEEMAIAQGRLIAAGCGPPGLSALLRSVVSRAVDVSKVWNGDLSGHATVYTESFES